MKFEYQIEITVDTNDGDYETVTNYIKEKELNEFRPLIESIKNFNPYSVMLSGVKWVHSHNFPNHGEYSPRKDLGELSVYELYKKFHYKDKGNSSILDKFLDYIPDCHSIIGIEIFYKPIKIKLL